MGEFAIRKSDLAKIKIGTCSDMFYLRFDDLNKIEALDHNVNPSVDAGLRFRLPLPEEDDVEPGNYESHRTDYCLMPGYRFKDAPQDGIHQVYDTRAGVLINLRCMHGESLPDLGPNATALFNGKAYGWTVLSSIKTQPAPEAGVGFVQLLPVISCRFCREAWLEKDWNRVLPWIHNDDLKQRLMAYRDFGVFRLGSEDAATPG